MIKRFVKYLKGKYAAHQPSLAPAALARVLKDALTEQEFLALFEPDSGSGRHLADGWV